MEDPIPRPLSEQLAAVVRLTAHRMPRKRIGPRALHGRPAPSDKAKAKTRRRIAAESRKRNR